MKIYIVTLKEEKAMYYKQEICNFINYLKHKEVDINNVDVEICSNNVVEDIEILNSREDNLCEAINNYFIKLNYMNDDNLDLINLSNLMYGVDNRDIAFIVIGDLKIRNNWGDAQGICAVIGNDHPKNIWHEVAHIFGADDHYDAVSHLPTSVCKSKDCIMRFGELNGELCDESIKEIERYINHI